MLTNGIGNKYAGLLLSIVLFAVFAGTSHAIDYTEIKLTAPDGAATDYFGISVATDGDTVVAGAHYDDDNGATSGSAYLFKRVGSNWYPAKLTASDGVANDQFGYSVAVDGDTIVVGAPNDDSKRGSAYVYQWDGTYWLEKKLTASDGASGDEYGCSVSVEGGTVLVGSRFDDDKGTDSGAVYLYQWDGANWNETKLTASDGGTGDKFGHSARLDGDSIVAGAYGDDDAALNAGAVYLYQWDGAHWNETKLTANDGAANDVLGFSVDKDGNTIIAGAYCDDDKGTDSGAAYIFKWNGTSWSQTKLIANDVVAGDRYGMSVSAGGNTIFIGAYNGDALGGDSGMMYAYNWDGWVWNETKLTASDGAASDMLGYSCAASKDGKTLVAGSFRDDDKGADSGSAYIFRDPSADDDTSDPTSDDSTDDQAVNDSVDTIIQEINENEDLIRALEITGGSSEEVLAKIDTANTAILSELSDVEDRLGLALTAINVDFQPVSDLILQASQALTDEINENQQLIGTMSGALLDELQASETRLSDALGSMTVDSSAITGLIDSASAEIVSQVNENQELIESTQTNVLAGITDAEERLSQAVAGINLDTQPLTGLINDVNGEILAAMQASETRLSDALGSMTVDSSAITGLIDDVSGEILAAMQASETRLSDALGSMTVDSSAITGLIDSASSEIVSQVNENQELIESTQTNVLAGITGAEERLSQAIAGINLDTLPITGSIDDVGGEILTAMQASETRLSDALGSMTVDSSAITGLIDSASSEIVSQVNENQGLIESLMTELLISSSLIDSTSAGLSIKIDESNTLMALMKEELTAAINASDNMTGASNDALSAEIVEMSNAIQTALSEIDDSLTAFLPLIALKLDAIQQTNDGIDRIKIEELLASGTVIASLCLPESLGGYMETVQDIVSSMITQFEATGFDVSKAQKDYNEAMKNIEDGNIIEAYKDFSDAYQELMKCKKSKQNKNWTWTWNWHK